MALPNFNPPTLYDLRRFWVKYRSNEDVRRLILEVEHQRRLLRAVEEYRVIIDRCWKADVGGSLVAPEKLKVLILLAACEDLARHCAPMQCDVQGV